MRYVLTLITILWSAFAAAQETDVMKAAMYLCGASCREETDQSLVELLEGIRGRPAYVNSNRLRSSAILSDYQVAVIKDYRSRTGDILSWDELALLEGFSSAFVEVMRPFLSLYSSRIPGRADTVKTHAQAFVRTTLTSAGGKAKVTGRQWRAGGALRCLDGFKKWDWTAFGEASIRGSRIVAGDYTVRFAEGLAQWSGFSVESLSTVDAFVKRSQGVSPAWSFTSSGHQRGLAYEYTGTRFRTTAFGSIDKTFGARAEYLGMRFQAGVTAAYPLMISADAKLNLRGALISAEAAWKNKAFAGKGAALIPLGESFRLAAQTRIMPSKYSGKKNGEYAFASGLEYRSRQFKAYVTADASLLPIPAQASSRFQLRSYGILLWKPNEKWSLEGRVTERYRNYENPRTDVRLQAGFNCTPWVANVRTEAVWCAKNGILGYAEGGYNAVNFSLWLRITGFSAAQWADRFYVYERDAPGNFTVAQYYGKGGSASVYANWKHRFRFLTLKAYLRAACTFKNGHRPAPVLNFQLAVDI